MAFNNGFFRGNIGNKTISDYKNKLDYNIESLDERKTKVKELLSIETIDGVEFSNEEFWNEDDYERAEPVCEMLIEYLEIEESEANGLY